MLDLLPMFLWVMIAHGSCNSTGKKNAQARAKVKAAHTKLRSKKNPDTRLPATATQRRPATTRAP